MPFTTAGRNALLDGQSAAGITHVGAFNGDPESGGSAVGARAAVSFSAASASQKVASNQPALSIPGGSTVAWLGFYTASTGGTLMGKADVTDEAFGSAGTYTVTAITLALS